jgi:hypothetical protein
MKRARAGILSLLMLLLASCVVPVSAGKSDKGQVRWIEFQNERLVYGSDQYGNRVPDFSAVGYETGLKPIPDVAVKATVDPAPAGDDTPRIQAAIDELAKQPMDANGFRGALLLHAGVYRIVGTIHLNASGIVLRGSGTSEHDTMLVAEGMPHTVLSIGGEGEWQGAGPTHAILDNYVPIGSSAITVDNDHDLKPGDRIIVQWAMGAAFIHAIGMDQIPPRKDGRAVRQWPPTMALHFDRRIVGVEHTAQGERITLDAPLTNAMAREEGAFVFRYSFPDRIDHVGVENLRTDGTAFEKTPGYGNPQTFDESGGTTKFVGGGFFDSLFVKFASVENAWMRNVVVTHYSNIVAIGQHARAVTVTDVQGIEIHTPETRSPPQAFSFEGQQSLIENCSMTGDFNHVWMTQARVAGPDVFYNCTAKGYHLDAGPHQRWATGVLYDNLRIQGAISVINRNSMGTGHGWAGANNVLWNCEAESYQVETPTVAYNWAFGVKAELKPPQFGMPEGQIVSSGKHLQPQSLYQQQLQERLAALGAARQGK